MNWGKWIIVSFILFAGFIGTLVAVCVREDISLVSKTYYKEELNYQEQVKHTNNTNALARKPAIEFSEGRYLIVKYPDFTSWNQAELKLVRPSNASMDRTFSITNSTDSLQLFDVHNLDKGMYRAKLSWEMNNEKYFIEEIINL